LGGGRMGDLIVPPVAPVVTPEEVASEVWKLRPDAMKRLALVRHIKEPLSRLLWACESCLDIPYPDVVELPAGTPFSRVPHHWWLELGAGKTGYLRWELPAAAKQVYFRGTMAAMPNSRISVRFVETATGRIRELRINTPADEADYEWRKFDGTTWTLVGYEAVDIPWEWVFVEFDWYSDEIRGRDEFTIMRNNAWKAHPAEEPPFMSVVDRVEIYLENPDAVSRELHPFGMCIAQEDNRAWQPLQALGSVLAYEPASSSPSTQNPGGRRRAAFHRPILPPYARVLEDVPVVGCGESEDPYRPGVRLPGGASCWVLRWSGLRSCDVVVV